MKFIVPLFSLLLLLGCASTNLKPVTDEGFVFQEDEKRLWLRSLEEQAVINKSGLLYVDPTAEAYLNHVAAKLHDEKVFKHIPIRVYILKDAHLNAFAYPNGAIYVHTGIIARAENEAQLATLLAHEMTHCTHRHAAKSFRSIKNKTAFMSTLQATVGSIGVVGSLASVLGSLGTVAAVTGYSRELETEADTEAFKLVVQAGYDPREAPKLFLHLKEELEEENIEESYFFGSHPQLADRISNYEEMIQGEGVKDFKDDNNTKVFLDTTKEIILVNAILDLRLGRFNSARKGLDKYQTLVPHDATAYYYQAEVCRQRGETGDIDQSIVYFEKCIAIDSGHAEAHRDLGLIYYKKGDKDQARQYLERYLSLAPQAEDRGYILHYLEKLAPSAKGEL